MGFVGEIGGFEARIGFWGGSEELVKGDVAVRWRRVRYPLQRYLRLKGYGGSEAILGQWSEYVGSGVFP